MKKNINILNKKSILKQLGFGGHLFIIFISTIFLIASIIFIWQSIVERTDTIPFILNIILGFIIFIFSFYFIFYVLRIIINIQNKNYIIILDELMDKYYYRDVPSTEVDNSAWHLYFKEYFRLYNKKVRIIHYQIGNRYKAGDKFYLVFVKGKKNPFIFAVNEYELGITEQEKISSFSEASDYINFKKFTIKENDNKGAVTVDKKRLIRDFLDINKIVNALICTLVSVFAIIMIVTFWEEGLPVIIIGFMFLLVFGLISVSNINYMIRIVTNIRKNRYVIKIDKVVSINEETNYRSLNSQIKLKFEDYKENIYVERKYYNSVRVGDEFYLVFIKGNYEPIKIYNVKENILNLNN